VGLCNCSDIDMIGVMKRSLCGYNALIVGGSVCPGLGHVEAYAGEMKVK
jgi:hypothetical protein